MDFINSLIPITKEATIALMGTFIIFFVGYAIGHIKVKGICLGTAGVFLMALLFGWLSTLPVVENLPIFSNFFLNSDYLKDLSESSGKIMADYKFVQDMGLILFVTSVGFIAGPNFFHDLKKNAKSYVPLGAIIIVIGAAVAVLFALVPGIGADYSTGILSGALTSTPAFSAAQGVAKDESLVALGHAVAYPFGVIGVVLFVQIVPKMLKVNMADERAVIKLHPPAKITKKSQKKFMLLDEFGLASFAIAIILGIVLGSIKIPLSSQGFKDLYFILGNTKDAIAQAGLANGFGGPSFSLGNTGGPLIIALICGHLGHVGAISLKVPENVLKIFRELGLAMFLVGAGVEGGANLVSQVSQSPIGINLIIYGFIGGVVMTVLPLVIGFVMAKYVFKLPLLNNLGSLTGGMTSTPALGTLIGVAGTEDVASAYASTYPISLVLVVLASNLIGTFMN